MNLHRQRQKGKPDFDQRKQLCCQNTSPARCARQAGPRLFNLERKFLRRNHVGTVGDAFVLQHRSPDRGVKDARARQNGDILDDTALDVDLRCYHSGGDLAPLFRTP